MSALAENPSWRRLSEFSAFVAFAAMIMTPIAAVLLTLLIASSAVDVRGLNDFLLVLSLTLIGGAAVGALMIPAAIFVGWPVWLLSHWLLRDLIPTAQSRSALAAAAVAFSGTIAVFLLAWILQGGSEALFDDGMGMVVAMIATPVGLVVMPLVAWRHFRDNKAQ